MIHLRRPGIWFIAAAVLTITTLFFVGGAAGGLVAAAAITTFIVGAFLALRETPPEDRTAGTGIFGGWL